MKTPGTLYWYGLRGEVLLETNNSGGNQTEYILFNGQRIARRDPSGTVYYYFGDRLGTSRIITASAGSVCYEADFLPFGAERVLTDTCAQNYKFTGHERDPESGLDHTWYRQYATTLGRWTAPDPVMASPGQPQSLNRYGYVVNNPTNFRDCKGLFHEYFFPPYSPCEPEGSPFDIGIILDGQEIPDWILCPLTPFPGPDPILDPIALPCWLEGLACALTPGGECVSKKEAERRMKSKKPIYACKEIGCSNCDWCCVQLTGLPPRMVVYAATD